MLWRQRAKPRKTLKQTDEKEPCHPKKQHVRQNEPDGNPKEPLRLRNVQIVDWDHFQ